MLATNVKSNITAQLHLYLKNNKNTHRTFKVNLQIYEI